MTIWFDMDGTIADLYGVEGWLEDIKAQRTRPYDEARTLVNMSWLARLLHQVQAQGHEIGIISWTAKGGSELYNDAVVLAKTVWLHRHLPSITWDEIKIVPYGTPKKVATHGDILFDDEEPNRTAWGEGAFTPEMIFNVLKGMR